MRTLDFPLGIADMVLAKYSAFKYLDPLGKGPYRRMSIARNTAAVPLKTSSKVGPVHSVYPGSEKMGQEDSTNTRVSHSG